MADATVAQVLLDAAKSLGDSQQETYTNEELQPWYEFSYRELWDLCMRWRLPVAFREVLYTLPANTTSLTPATAGITNMGDPQKLWERLAGSSENYIAMTPVDELPQITAETALRWWKWEGDTFYFIGSGSSRQLKIEYIQSGAAPTSGSIGFDNCRNFLATRTASLMAGIRGMPQEADRLTVLALGPSREADGSGGQLRTLVLPLLHEKQNRSKRPGTFRPRRFYH
jgi:hypothetical protein